jgi:predicted tellurium resistance membrane protein TerC
MEWIHDPSAWVALATLTAIEIVLGLDNIIFISILVAKLAAAQQPRARLLGLGLAMVMRILLLLSIAWVMRLTAPLFEILHREISGRDLILIIGGLFLIAKSTLEIHEKLEGDEDHGVGHKASSFAGIIVQIMLLDIVFSLDSVITAIGLAKHVPVMICAIVIAVLVMMASAGALSRFIEQHPTVKILALSFLLLIGLALVAEGVEIHIPKTAIYFAMAFSVFVEMLNIKIRGRQTTPVHLRGPQLVEGDPERS